LTECHEKKIILLILLIFLFVTGHAQLTVSPQLKAALENKSSFQEVMQTVTDYYIQNGYMTNPVLFREFKKWNRWAWYEMRHLDQHGNFVDGYRKVEPLLEIAEEEKKGGSQNSRMTNGGGWSSYGPYSISDGIGRVDRLAFHPTDPNHIYAGTPASGLWESTNGGSYWFPLNGYTPALGVSGIIVDMDNPNNIYVLSGDGDSFGNGGLIYTRNCIGLMRSIDGGVNWSVYSNIAPSGTSFFGFKLMQSKEIHYLYFACTTNGLYRSNDYGRTWSKNASIGSEVVMDIEQADNGYIYASTERRVFISSNWGNTFSIASDSLFSIPPDGNCHRTDISVPPNAQNVLYVHFGGDSLMYKSMNNGTTFTLMNSNAPKSRAYMSAMTINPGNSNNIILGALQISTSTNGGQTFPNIGANIHADVHELAYNLLDNALYAACDGGVYKSFDNGMNWVDAYDGMNTSQFYHMACFPTNNGILLAGAQDNGVHMRNGSSSYAKAAEGDGFDAKFFNGNSDSAYYSLNAIVYKYSLTTNLSAQTLLPGGNGDDLNYFFPHLAIHPTNNNIVYAGYISDIYKTTNGGASWTTIGNSGSAGFAAAGGLAVSANIPDRLYAANGTSAWRFENQGNNMTLISSNSGWPAGSPIITDIQTRPNNGNEVIVTFGGYGGQKIIYSSNGGNSWVNLTGSLPDLPAYCAEFTSDGDIYLGTDAGVYFKDNAWSDWARFSNGLPVVPVTELIVDETNGKINAATFGRGIWQGDLYSDCGPFLLLSGTTEGTNFYQSNGFIETSQVVPGSYGNALLLRCPQKIKFENGFRAYQNSYLHVVIGNCGQGVLNINGGKENDDDD